MGTLYGPTGIPSSATAAAPCTYGVLVTVADFEAVAVTPHPSGIPGLPPQILRHGDTLRLPPAEVQRLVDRRVILDPSTGRVKPADAPVISPMGIAYHGTQDEALERYDREVAAEKAQQDRAQGYARGGRQQARATGSFDPLGPIEGVDLLVAATAPGTTTAPQSRPRPAHASARRSPQHYASSGPSLLGRSVGFGRTLAGGRAADFVDHPNPRLRCKSDPLRADEGINPCSADWASVQQLVHAASWSHPHGTCTAPFQSTHAGGRGRAPAAPPGHLMIAADQALA